MTEIYLRFPIAPQKSSIANPLLFPKSPTSCCNRYYGSFKLDTESASEGASDNRQLGAGDLSDSHPLVAGNISDNLTLEAGDSLLHRRCVRDPNDLEKNGFDPVWTSWGGFPGDIPGDIQEWLDPDGTRSCIQVIGHLSSLAWLGGLDELARAMQYSVYRFADEVAVVPIGTSVLFPLEQYITAGLLPPLDDGLPVPPCRQKGASVPNSVTSEPKIINFKDLYATARGQHLPEVVRTVKLEASVTALLGSQSRDLWFRGLSLEALESTLTFFVPQVNSINRFNEFGPVFYSSNRLACALNYVQRSGAIMVFKDTSFQQSTIWELSLVEWTAWISHWLGLNLQEARKDVPPQYRLADFVKGPVSETHPNGYEAHPPTQSDTTQLVAVSYDGLGTMSRSLYMIVYVQGA
ncbi:hypothetical protein N7495_001019 [Penicillium taxi]|uniref:uncharacterized protein n=1 Tax=Penicillium taxi TaxID=168475 RepID=UPI002544DA62|nr:uncharacterized protein N7495_001019 [Penicillium taxi]KAJ5908337.1 hypothetical protein N7495_001019 [Penicillium taxi]